ncbi:MAG: hypothetical protein MUC49_14490 [Raineya sp.]|jgi:hypothetical protein|nr:hypothetical protein [Raineya sp.]
MVFFKMSKYLPIENIIYKTNLSKEQVIQRLTENIETKKSFGIYSKPYIGKIMGNHFEIERAISYRNSFLPQIKGEIYSEFNRTKIEVYMRPHLFVLFFMVIWLGGISMGCLVTLSVLFTGKFEPPFLIPFGMLIFGIALLYGAFKTESAISKRDLMKMLDAEIEK